VWSYDGILGNLPFPSLNTRELIGWLRNCQLAVKFGPVAWINTRAEPIRCIPDGSFSTLPETSCAQISTMTVLCVGFPQSFHTNVWIVAFVTSPVQFAIRWCTCHSMLCMSWRSGSTSYRLVHTLLW